MNVLRNNFLCIIVYTIVFDMQYRPFYLRGPSNVDTMSNLVVLKERGHNFQHRKQCVTLQYLTIHDKVFLHKQLQKLLLSKFPRNGLWKGNCISPLNMFFIV